MATPKDPNKTLLEEQALIDAAARVEAGKVASVVDSQLVVDGGDTFKLTVEGGEVTAIDTVTAPGAPTIGAATAGDGEVSVAFTAPASDGGMPITSYTATSTPGGLTGTGTASPIVVEGLTNDTEYTFKVKATNAVGTGAESAASAAATPTAA